MVVHTYGPSRKLRKENGKLKPNQSNLVRLVSKLKIQRMGDVAQCKGQGSESGGAGMAKLGKSV